MQHHLQNSLSTVHCVSPKPLSHPKPLFLINPRIRTRRVRFGVSATARLGVTEPKQQKVATMYDLLSVTQTAGLDEIKAAYRKVARQWHPDSCRSENKEYCTQQFIKAQEAYKVLSDPVLREDYDFGLEHGVNGILTRQGSRKTRVSGFGDWESQLEGLLARSNSRKSSSWGSRMRSKQDQR